MPQLVAAVRESGVDFEVTQAVEQELVAAGATPELVTAARAGFRAQAGTTAAQTAATPQGAQRTAGPTPTPTPGERDAATTDGPPSSRSALSMP